MQIIARPYDLPLKYTFRISREERNIQKTLIMELQSDGVSGYGEATANPYYGVSIEQMLEEYNQLKGRLESIDYSSPSTWWPALHELLPNSPFLLCALDVAATDLDARKKKMPLYEVWGLELSSIPISNFTIGIGPIEEMIERLKETPWPVYKIKLGTDRDLEIVKALRDHSDAIFRVDANCAWSLEQTLEYAPILKTLGVQFIEQPLPADQWEAMEELFHKSPLPIVADESCQAEADVAKCVGRFHGINIKLMKCGGLTPALRMISQARSHDMKVMVGCMTESSVGISAIGHLLPLLDYVDMDGSFLLKQDIATGVHLYDGKVVFPMGNGTGAELINLEN